MKPTDTSEKGLEQLIVRHLAGISEHPAVAADAVRESPRPNPLGRDEVSEDTAEEVEEA